MSAAVGPMSVLPGPGEQPMFGFDGNEPAPATRELVDSEVRRLLDEGSRQAPDARRERPRLDSLVDALLAAETLDADEAYRAAGIARAEGANEPSVGQTPVEADGSPAGRPVGTSPG
jgi:cell division protease FtsH